MKHDLNDINIVQSAFSRVKSRSDVNIKNEYNKLPIFNAPMYSVISKDSVYNKNFIKKIYDLDFNVVLPRNINYDKLDKFVLENKNNIWFSISLEEADNLVNKGIHEIFSFFEENDKVNILIDVANGNMLFLHEIIKSIKNKYPNITIMSGNAGSPECYRELCIAGSDYIRIAVGTGDSCITSTQSAIHYPMASLISECYEIQNNMENKAKIIADGGFKTYSDIIKALALGANYVMVGSILSSMLESDNVPYLFKFIPIKNKFIANFLFKSKIKLYKKHYGMSTKIVQKMWKSSKLRSSEGRIVWKKIDYKINGWLRNLEDYLRNAMSYTDSFDLNEFKKSDKIVVSYNSYRKVDK